ncbi:hypothetical protein KC19_VG113200 [Ceratodon purpureus]|uniref:P-type H(+)-exporting transporter n=2 Tax=Ceratodon purpureus TaxID=3225 RepID=A0A8T0HPG2_CERPU|nr:hypothetical protein KC19_VG113200 [Ceratodon purpureus]
MDRYEPPDEVDTGGYQGGYIEEEEEADLEHLPIEEAFLKLKATREGLSTMDADVRIKLVGPNKLEEHKDNKLLKFLLFMWNPLSWVMETAAAMALVLDNGDNRPPDWQDFIGIVCLLFINATVSYIEETNAGEAADALMQALAPKSKVLRDGIYAETDASILVPGDIITIRLGDIIPADARLLEGDPLLVDQSSLTGESVAVTKRPGEAVYSGSICKQGEIEALVIATGIHTFFGKAAHLVDTTHHTAIEEMAGMDILCSDKTGTLTLNRLTVDRAIIELTSATADKDMLILTASHASRIENQDPIDLAICSMLPSIQDARKGIKEVHFLPFNPTDKRTAMTYITSDGNMHRATKGAPEQILALAANRQAIETKVHEIINKYAEHGLRSLGVAYQEVPEQKKDSPGGPWEMLGLLPLFDPPRHDTCDTVHRALELGVSVKMITGDQLAIAKETGRRLGMGTNMYPSTALFSKDKDGHGDLGIAGMDPHDLIEQADGFAGEI